jgi:replicative superfamily II helicase
MTFHGLFIGIDRHASQGINWLSCAKRDAIALHALFADTLGGETVLLTDHEATRAAIETHFTRLSECSADDMVVITFSGHGSESHELVTYDADPADLSRTAIPLDQLADWFSRIPARRLVCVLDCCFSGGIGAKVLKIDAQPRSLSSTDALLIQLSGEGRLILTASLPTEEAWESAKVGHGLLTYHLLQALQGAEEVRTGSKIGLYRLLEFVTTRVIDGAAGIGKSQHPTLRGTIDGEVTWPVFRPGPAYAAAFPDRGRPKVAAEIQSLEPYGFPPALLNAWAAAIPGFNQLQLDAINEFGILDGEHLVVSAPTSSGKTMIGELAALRAALDRRRTFFLFPLKAIVNDKYRHFNAIYGPFGIRTIRATGDSTSDDLVPLMRGQYDICLLTYEKFTALALGNPHLLDQIGAIVIDEVQMIADASRGVNLEFLLTFLKVQRHRGIEPQIIALSAVIGDTKGLERWLGARLLRRTERPVPLDEGILRRDGTFRFIASDLGEEKEIPNYVEPEYAKGSSQDLIRPLARKLVTEGKRLIVFRETKGEARGTAKYLAAFLGLPPAEAALSALPAGDPSLASGDLRDVLSGGVAFHISDLEPDERALVEEQFRLNASNLRVLAATTTLAMGVNTPAEAVIIAGLEHPGEEPYSIAEYKNIAGRAGRLGFAQRGTSYLVALTPHDEHYLWSRYVLGRPEDLESRFLVQDTDPRSVILRVLVAAQRATGTVGGLRADDIVGFLEESFGAFLKKTESSVWRWDSGSLLTSLESLRSHNLVSLGDDGRYHLTSLGRFAGEAGVEVESIVRLVEALSGNSADAISDPTLVAATQLTVELDQVLFPINRKSTQKEPQTWEAEIRRQNVPGSVIRALHMSVQDAHEATLRAKKAVTCLLWITSKPLTEIESILTQFGGAFGGAAGPIRSVRSRTCDLLPTTARVAEILYPGLDLGSRMRRLLARLEIGVPSELAELAMAVGTVLTRGDYLQLLKAGLSSMESIRGAPKEVLLRCVGRSESKVKALDRAVNPEQPITAPASPPILPDYAP